MAGRPEPIIFLTGGRPEVICFSIFAAAAAAAGAPSAKITQMTSKITRMTPKITQMTSRASKHENGLGPRGGVGEGIIFLYI